MKIFVIDTNVFIRVGKYVLSNFDDNEVVVPFVVIQELENLRSKNDSVGKYARSVLREIEKLSIRGNIHEGVTLENGGKFRVELNHVTPELPTDIFPRGSNRPNDIRILTVAYNLKAKEQAKPKGQQREVILITDDIPLRIYSQISRDSSVRAEPYQGKTTRFSGLEEVAISDEFLVSLVESTKPLEAPRAVVSAAAGAKRCFIALTSSMGGNPIYCVYVDGFIQKCPEKFGTPLRNVKTRNIEQKLALEYLLDDDVAVASLSGKAGSGKTMLAVAAGLSQSIASSVDAKFKKVLVYRPMYAVGGQEMGFLPGDIKDKIAPWEEAVYDSVHGVLHDDLVNKAKEDRVIGVESITHIRGRTLKDTFIIVDEAQNFSEVLLLEIQSRVGSGSKIVFLWDSTQRDNHNVGYNDGPVALADRMKKHSIFGHITLSTSQRSEVAELAGHYLEEHFG